jgi:bifunctional DNase/RNase
MLATTDVGFIEMRIAKVVGFAPPLADGEFQCVVLDEVSGDRHLVVAIGRDEAFHLAATLQDLRFGRPMTYEFTAALVRVLGGQVRQVRIDRLVEGAVAATVEVAGPLGVELVDARSSDALNLAAITTAPIFVSSEVVEDGRRWLEDGSAEAGLLRHALTAPAMRVTRATE